MKNSQGGEKKKNKELTGFYYSIYLGLSLGTQGTEENHLVKGPVLHTLGLLPHKGKERKRENGLLVKPPYHSLFLVTPLSLFSPSPEAIWGHSYPKIYRRIKKKVLRIQYHSSKRQPSLVLMTMVLILSPGCCPEVT